MESTVMAQQNTALGTLNLIDGKFGRKVIYTSVPTIDESNVVEVLTKALGFHRLNEINIDYLEKYYTGNQPILYRTKDVRPEINNKIVENHAFEIVEFMADQNFGEPVQYVRVGTNEKESNDIQKLNRIMAMCDKGNSDIELGKWRSICGTSYRVCYPKNSEDMIDGKPVKVGIDVLRPQDTFIVYSSSIGHEPMLGVSRSTDENSSYIYTCYTKNMCYKIKDGKIIDNQINGVGKVIIVEYPNNSRRLGDIEIVISLLDAINNMQSNRLDGIEQFIQAFLLFTNCQIDKDTFLEMCKLGALTVKGEVGLPADVKSISNQLDQTQTQVAKDDLWESILSILGLPNRQENSGGDTGAAVVYRNGWQFSEQRAELSSMIFEKSEREFLRIALKILSINEILNIDLADIEIKITRSKADNIAVKTQALQSLLMSGINSQVAIKTCNLWSDSEDVYIKSKDVMEKKYGMESIDSNQNVNNIQSEKLV